MAIFQLKWLKAFLRRHTKPIPSDRAATWKQRLSIIYAVTAWNAFGFVLYMVYTGKADWAKYHGIKNDEEIRMTPAQQWTKTLGIKDATVYRVSGFKVSKYEVHNEFENDKRKGPTTKSTDEAQVS